MSTEVPTQQMAEAEEAPTEQSSKSANSEDGPPASGFLDEPEPEEDGMDKSETNATEEEPPMHHQTTSTEEEEPAAAAMEQSSKTVDSAEFMPTTRSTLVFTKADSGRYVGMDSDIEQMSTDELHEEAVALEEPLSVGMVSDMDGLTTEDDEPALPLRMLAADSCDDLPAFQPSGSDSEHEDHSIEETPQIPISAAGEEPSRTAEDPVSSGEPHTTTTEEEAAPRVQFEDPEEPSTINPGNGNKSPPPAVKKSLRRRTQLSFINEMVSSRPKEDFYGDLYDDSEEEGSDPAPDAATDDGSVASAPPLKRFSASKSAASDAIRNMRRRSAIMFTHHAFDKNRHLIEAGMSECLNKINETYLREGDGVLLHGYLHINIIRAKNLRNSDCLRGCGKMMKWLISDVSDPYVTVHAGPHRLVKTPVIMDNLDPEWNQDFYVPVCHPLREIEFRVKDWDNMSSEHLGTTKLSVHELITFSDEDKDEAGDQSGFDESAMDLDASLVNNNLTSRRWKLKRTGVHKTVFLDGKPHHGSLEYSVEFIPKNLLHNPPRNLGLLTKRSVVSMVVPGVYFPLRKNNRVRFYINADDKGQAPDVLYGGNLMGEPMKIWKPRRFFRDVYDSISRAQHMVYIVGWSVDYTISLLRGKEQIEGLNPTKDGGDSYSPFIGELLNRKANEGVTVNMLVWDDNTSNSVNKDGVVATRDEQLRDYFRGSKVNLRLVPMGGGKSNIAKQFRNAVYYTHHQKCVICDTPKKELVAYVGGIDLTYGRYDDGSYPLFRTLRTDHKEDFHQACCTVTRQTGPREPWHDIHSRVQGDGTLDLVKNFEERWIGQGGAQDDLVVLDEFSITTTPVGCLDEEDDDSWNTQLFRSIDERTARLKIPIYRATTFEEAKGVEFDESKKIKGGKRQTMLQKFLHTGPQRERHFYGDGHGTQETLTVSRPLDYKRDLQVDSSVHKALVHHIRNAMHTIYIESQYFLSSSFLWEEGRTTGKCCNLVAAEITFKICEKIELGQRFTCYIVVPMWPEGLPESSSVQDILFFQAITMRSMYKRIQKSIDLRRKKLKNTSVEAAREFADVTPRDYLNFYCLATREAHDGPELGVGLHAVHKSRRHLVYTHSKMTIVDDAIVICGSANVNQRSMDGGRDSELLMGSWQPKHLATPESIPEGDVHGFRLHCWAHLTGTMEEIYKKPSSLECVRRINEIAEHNWELYTQEEVVQMTSYLVPFPVEIMRDGDVVPSTADGKFPDTNSNIQGGVKPTLPKFLTT